jgi:Flp pilus assembly pilin Flp
LIVIELRYALLFIPYVRARAAEAKRNGRNELGASALEWAIISAIVVGLAIAISLVITRVVQSRTDEINEGG